MNKRAMIGILAVAVLAIAAGVAYATVPDSNGVINACYKTQNGQLRVIDSGSCHPSETSLSWSQTGPAGPPGPAGDDSTKTVAGAVNPDGTSQLATDDFTMTHVST